MDKKLTDKLNSILKTVLLISSIILVIITLRVVTGCGSTEPSTFGSAKIYSDTCLLLNKQDFTVWCSNENINSDLDEWFKAPFQEYESKQNFYKYGYIVTDTVNHVSTIYTMTLDLSNEPDTLYNICKRISVGKQEEPNSKEETTKK